MKLNKKNAHLKSLSKEIFINTGEVEIKKSKQPLIILFNDIIEKNISLSKEEKFNIMYHVTLAYLEKEKSIAIFFSVAAAAAPLIGLLGTVWGIIDAFMGMAVGGSGDLSSVAPGIAEALITTFAGLLVAIPALIFYHIINTKIKSIMSTIESIVIHILSNGSHHA
jgi:biopolymer transport protein ExbB/TolQ